MGLGQELIDLSKATLTSLSTTWSSIKQDSKLATIHQETMESIDRLISPIATGELKSDQILDTIRELIESQSMSELLNHNFGIMPLNGPGLSRKTIQLLTFFETQIETGSPQAIELAEYMGESVPLANLINAVPSIHTIDLYKSLLEKCPEDQRERLAEGFPPISAKDTTFGTYTMYT